MSKKIKVHFKFERINKFLILLFVCFISVVQAQVLSEAMALKELEKRGLTEGEVRTELLNRGVNLDEIDPNDPTSVIAVEKAIREVIGDLEEKKRLEQEAELVDDVKAEEGVEKEEPSIEIVENTDEIKEAIMPGDDDIFGHHLFKGGGIKVYSSVNEHIPGDNYIIGPGDQISISIWGLSDRSYSTVVANEGFITTRNIRIFVSGLTLREARNLITQRLRNIHTFRDDEININLVVARKIDVNVVGEAITSGSYNISAVNNALSAIVAAGGISEIGTVRNIQLIRSGNENQKIDLYQYLFNPSISLNFSLTNNDIISISPSGPIVSISGEVKRNGRYEMLESETLSEIITYAGGYTSYALKNSIEVERIEGSSRIVLDVDAQDSDNITLKDGDVIRIKRVIDRVDNLVQVTGAVDNPGKFAFAEGMRISSIISKAILSPAARTDISIIKRKNSDNKTHSYNIFDLSIAIQNPGTDDDIEIKSGDEIIVYSQQDYVDNYSVEIEGPVRNPGIYPLDSEDQLRVSDLIFLAGGNEKELAEFGFIYRKKPGIEKTLSYIRVSVSDVLNDPNSDENITLEPNDRLILRDVEFYSQANIISVAGAVNAPNEFLYSPTLNLSNVIKLAGGLQFEADPSRIDIYRLNFGENKTTETTVANVRLGADGIPIGGDIPLLPFDKIFVRYASEYEDIQTVSVTGEVKFPGDYGLISDNPRLSELIKQAGDITQEAFLEGATLERPSDDVGFIIIDLRQAMANPGNSNDIVLKAGDVINIPKVKSYVRIEGATNIADVYNTEISMDGKVNVVHEPGKRAKYFIDQYAGGFSENADRKGTTVEYPNGQVKEAKQILFFTNYPKVEEGSVIRVPVKKVETAEEKERKEIDWAQVLNNTIAQVTSILTLLLLANNLN